MANDFIVFNDQVQIDLNRFSLKSDEFGKLSSLKTRININPCEIELASFNLVAEESILKGDLSLRSQNSSLGFINHHSILNLNLKKGHKLKFDDLIPKRPATGISPIHIKKILGKRLKRNLLSDTILQWKHIS